MSRSHGLGRPGAADTGEYARLPDGGQVERVGQTGVDGGLPGPGVDHERVRSLTADAHVDRLGRLARHRAHGDRNPGPPLDARVSAASAEVGGRAKVTSGSTGPWAAQDR